MATILVPFEAEDVLDLLPKLNRASYIAENEGFSEHEAIDTVVEAIENALIAEGYDVDPS